MGKIITTRISTFSGGISEDKRSKNPSRFSLTKHFDALTYPHKLVPYIKSEAVETKAFKITKFLFALERSTTSTFYIYGFGKNSGVDKIRVYRMSASGSSWGSGANNISGLDKKEGCFVYYYGYIYMFAGTTKLIRYDTSGSDAFEDDVVANVFSGSAISAFSTIAQGVIHPADDRLYLFTDNIVHIYNGWGDVWSLNALTLRDDMKIVDATPYGNYLAIACVTKGAEQHSYVYLWDRDSSLIDVSAAIDFGSGNIIYIANLNNRLIAVMNFYLSSVFAQNKPRLLIKQALRQFGIKINELIADTIIATNTISVTKFVEGDKLYFPRSIPLNSDTRNGIWVVDSEGRITLDYIEEEVDSASIKIYNGIFKLGNQWLIAHSADGSVNRTDDNNVYSTTLASIYESLINGGDRRLRNDLTKKLIGVTVMTEPLPTAGKIVLKYRKDEETSWTTIFTETTNDSISFDAINISGATLPEFKEIQFQINSTGGAVITGLKFKSEFIDKQKY